ncbi:WD40 repeat-like protein [Viridothelium virens]|uniref:WD40 repeat-like protein n=1 Tax=Viridothelium virens TaxID=1048519 RepID=A0A6A6HIB8_VIRVR|nr:WD40 repeat-like protein [Viridothelium virens]
MAGKRKRGAEPVNGEAKKRATGATPNNDPLSPITIQIITGSYERALHGFTATIPRATLNSIQEEPQATLTDTSQKEQASTPEDSSTRVSFSDTFLFNAHRSSLTTLALSPLSPTTSKITLATGSTDAQIQLYSLSTSPPAPSSVSKPTLTPTPIHENPQNRELGTLQHHASTVTHLAFPTHGKLLSASLDNTIGVTRARDWTLLSSIKAPVPKAVGRPSGDTAAQGEVPAGVNAFAVHPSMKLCVSVGRGERCMRLWNLVTGKKAGVLNFSRELLARAGEGKFGRGEGLSVVWDDEGEEFAVGFERGVVVYELDARPRSTIIPSPRTKVGRLRYLPLENKHRKVLALSTEDGRVLFYDTTAAAILKDNAAQPQDGKDSGTDVEKTATFLGQLGGRTVGVSGRIKDFKVLVTPDATTHPQNKRLLIITASSDGAVRVWSASHQELEVAGAELENGEKEVEKTLENGAISAKVNGNTTSERQIGKLLGTYETGHRITCLEAFIMSAPASVPEDSTREKEAWEGAESSSSDDDEEDDEEE